MTVETTASLHVLGLPIRHSRSPVFQNAALRAAGLDAVYTAREVDAAGMHEVAAQVRQGDVLGCNITLPHKALAASLCDELTADARACGVVNTWYRRGDRLVGDNTDIHGVRVSCAALLGRRAPRQVVVLGAGGAVSAALYAVAPLVERVVIVNRTPARAVEAWRLVADHLSRLPHVDVLPWPDDPTLAGAAAFPEAATSLDWSAVDLVLQGTSLPVLRPDDAAPFAGFPIERLPGHAGVLELAYAARPTVLMRRAADAGLATLDGATMLLHQGARSFWRWFDRDPDVVVMRDALADDLGRPRDAIPAHVDPAALRLWAGQSIER